MNYCKFINIIILGLIIGFPLSAEENEYERRFPMEEKQRLLIDQGRLRLLTIGINFYPVTTKIRSYGGSELIIRVDESSTFGKINPVEIKTDDKDGELHLILGFKSSTVVGVRIGSLNIEILVPSAWDGELELAELKSKTSIKDLHLLSLGGKTSITELSMARCSFGNVDIELGADTDLLMYSTDVGNCRIRGGLGKITGDNIEGTLDIQTFDGDISIDFSNFTGETSLVTKLGCIRASLPEGADADIDLLSRLSSAKCEIPLSVSEDLSDGRIRGSIGEPGSGNLLNLVSGDGDVIIVKSAGGTL